MPSGNGSSQKKAKPKAKKAPVSKSNGKNFFQKAEDAIGGMYDRSQKAKHDIYKGMGGQGGKGK